LKYVFPVNDDPLALDRETMRRLGYRTVDMLVERLADPSSRPIRRASAEEMRRRVPPTDPEQPEELARILEQLDRDVLPFASRDHPGFFAYVPFAGTWPGALGDLIASACNVYAGSWMESAGPSRLELEVLEWFKSWLGYPGETAGLLVSGGSAGNMTALACAREALVGPMSDRVVAYVSDQAHASVARSARVLGFRPNQMRVLPSDDEFRLRPDTLAHAMDADLKAGRRPLFAVANAGATNTGAVDPLGELADLCRERGVWLHVDAAYGGFAVLTERGRRLLDGIAEADSITLDPHKWLYQPYECGCVLVRQGSHLRQAFAMTPDYLRDAMSAEDEVDFSDLGMQLTRSTRALKLWVSIRYFGLAAFRRAIERSLDLAELAARRIEASDALELAAPRSLGVVCFRRRFPGVDDEAELEQRNAALVEALEESGIGLVSSTRLRGRYAIRMCILSHSSDEAAVNGILDFLEGADVASGPAERRGERVPAIDKTWAERPPVAPGAIRALPLFATLSEEEAELVAHAARVREASPGEAVISQWELSRDFYVIVEGAVDIHVDGKIVGRELSGEFFGELAGVDWGSGFAYSRLATVVAAERTRMLVFSSESLNEFAAAFPGVERALREAVHERLSEATP
jgi:aromatic-L-amino-acid/L-tryptophan decarboxylase